MIGGVRFLSPNKALRAPVPRAFLRSETGEPVFDITACFPETAETELPSTIRGGIKADVCATSPASTRLPDPTDTLASSEVVGEAIGIILGRFSGWALANGRSNDKGDVDSIPPAVAVCLTETVAGVSADTDEDEDDDDIPVPVDPKSLEVL